MYLTTLLVSVAFLGLTHAQGYGRQTFYGAGGGGDSGFNNGGYSGGQFHPRNNFPRFQNNPQFGNPNTGFGQSGAGFQSGDGSGATGGWNSGSSQFGGGQTSFSGQSNTGVNRNVGGSSTEVEAAGTQGGQVSQDGASRNDAPAAAAPTDIDTTGARTFNRDSQQSGAAVQPEPEVPAADTPQTGQQSGVGLPGTTTVDPNSDKLIPEPPVLGRK
ncbi:hypothetical protein Ddc_04957 [Ditylenchus destructor]|nr:hypothetical protein Ddc_04957 [Ditylenchus destructor]